MIVADNKTMELMIGGLNKARDNFINLQLLNKDLKEDIITLRIESYSKEDSKGLYVITDRMIVKILIIQEMVEQGIKIIIIKERVE